MDIDIIYQGGDLYMSSSKYFHLAFVMNQSQKRRRVMKTLQIFVSKMTRIAERS